MLKKCSRIDCENPLKDQDGLLSIDQFYKAKGCKDGYRTECKHCHRRDKRRFYKLNPEPIKAREHIRYKKNRIKILAQKKEYDRINAARCNAYKAQCRQDDIEKFRTRQRKWVNDHPDEMLVKAQNRRAAKLHATPPWAVELMKDYLWVANKFTRSISKKQGIKYHLDHIIALKARDPITRQRVVSGLNVPWNLQYLPARENISKGNRLLPQYMDGVYK